MAAPAVDTSNAITIGFGTSSFSAEIRDITPPNSSRGDIETSHQGTTDSHTYTPEELVDNGELEFEIHFNPDTTPPINAAAETITITFPAGGTWAFSGYMNSYAPSAPFNGKMVATVTVKVSGDITIVAAT